MFVLGIEYYTLWYILSRRTGGGSIPDNLSPGAGITNNTGVSTTGLSSMSSINLLNTLSSTDETLTTTTHSQQKYNDSLLARQLFGPPLNNSAATLPLNFSNSYNNNSNSSDVLLDEPDENDIENEQYVLSGDDEDNPPPPMCQVQITEGEIPSDGEDTLLNKASTPEVGISIVEAPSYNGNDGSSWGSCYIPFV